MIEDLTTKPLFLSVDIGGTFTDVTLIAPARAPQTLKVLSTPDDYSRAVVEGIARLIDKGSLAHADVGIICHGTTLGTNAVLERTGAPTALITTAGFRDVLEIRRLRFPDAYDIQWSKPEPLVSRDMRLEIVERVAADGSVVTPLEHTDIGALVERLKRANVRAVAVALINSYVNPEHEQAIAEAIRSALPDVFVTASHEVLPERGEYERTSTTVANAYLGPIMEGYLGTLRSALDARELPAPLLVGQSNGGLFIHEMAMHRPYLTLESGPAAGCVAARELAKACGVSKALALDMGGTTTKTSYVEDGKNTWNSEFEIGSELSASGRLGSGGGYTVRTPVIELAEVGAGGGSVAWIDSGGVMHVGPRSSGATPGPACYGLGGTEPTLTDANVVLGYIRPDNIADGALRLDRSAAESAIGELADQLRLSVPETALGIHRIANASMMSAIRAVSTRQGRDPRSADLIAFGGAGPVQAVGLADQLGIGHVLIPPAPGLFSTLGLLAADIEHHLTLGYVCNVAHLKLDRLNAALNDLEEKVTLEIARFWPGEAIKVERLATFRFHRRAGDVVVDLPAGEITEKELLVATTDFRKRYGAIYQRTPENVDEELVSLRVVGRIARGVSWHSFYSTDHQDASKPKIGKARKRDVYFGKAYGWVPTQVADRRSIEAETVLGPLVFDEPDTSVVIPPGWQAQVDSFLNIIIEKSDREEQ